MSRKEQMSSLVFQMYFQGGLFGFNRFIKCFQMKISLKKMVIGCFAVF